MQPTPKHISDADLLSFILDGSIIMRDLHTSDPSLLFRGRHIKPQLTRQSGRYRITEQCGRYTFQFSFGSKPRRTRKVVRSKLVWMYVNRRVVPPDHAVHHGPRGRLDDSIQNLELLHDNEHAAIHSTADEW
jgi:hypothetical protein